MIELIKTAQAMREFGSTIACNTKLGTTIYLKGDLGVGKTTFVRGFLLGLGYKGYVKSPTFNLVEMYQVEEKTICHFDLYRLKDPEELVYTGAADCFNNRNICLVEWPEHGEGFLQEANLTLHFDFAVNIKNRIVKVILRDLEKPI